MAHIHQCDCCGKEIDMMSGAGSLEASPMVPEELHRFKKDPAAIRALSLEEQKRLADMAAGMLGAFKSFEFCLACTNTIIAYVEEMKAAMRDIANGMRVQ